MRVLVVIIFIFHCTRCAFAGELAPLTTKEIGLMLRSGYSSETIMRDVSARHFADTLDPAAEKQLREANASPALLDALRSGNNAASAEEIAQARQRIAEGKIAAQKFAEQKRIAAREAAITVAIARKKEADAQAQAQSEAQAKQRAEEAALAQRAADDRIREIADRAANDAISASRTFDHH